MIEPSVTEDRLKKRGFTKGNPFSVKEADAEPFLEDCFYELPFFYEIKGSIDMPRSAFLVADRGCGKSTNRRILENQCREGRAGGLVLAVSYTDFGRLLERNRNGEAYTTRMHVEEILRLATIELLDLLHRHSSYIKRLYPEGYKRLFRWLLDQTDILSVEGLDRWLGKTKLLSQEANAQALLDIANGKQKNFLKEDDPRREIIGLLIGMLRQTPAEINLEEGSHNELFRRFVELTEWLGIKAVYVFIDRLDELYDVADNPDVSVQLIEPLIADLHLMDMPRTAFKIFIPSDIDHALREKQTIRIDRLPFKTIFWNVEDLVELLDLRIKTYSEGTFQDLAALSVQELSPISRLLAEEAQNSPRNLLRLGEWLLYHHISDPDKPRIDQDDVIAALSSFAQEQQGIEQISIPMTQSDSVTKDTPPPQDRLFLDEKIGKVWRYGKELESLTKGEFKLLKYLQENPGQILSHDDIIGAVYGEDEVFDDTRLYALIGRLRKKIDKDSDKEYVITIRGHGVRFNPFGE